MLFQTSGGSGMLGSSTYGPAVLTGAPLNTMNVHPATTFGTGLGGGEYRGSYFGAALNPSGGLLNPSGGLLNTGGTLLNPFGSGMTAGLAGGLGMATPGFPKPMVTGRCGVPGQLMGGFGGTLAKPAANTSADLKEMSDEVDIYHSYSTSEIYPIYLLY